MKNPYPKLNWGRNPLRRYMLIGRNLPVEPMKSPARTVICWTAALHYTATVTEHTPMTVGTLL